MQHVHTAPPSLRALAEDPFVAVKQWTVPALVVVAQHTDEQRLIACFPVKHEMGNVMHSIHQRSELIASLRRQAVRVALVAEHARLDRCAVQHLKAGSELWHRGKAHVPTMRVGARVCDR